MQPRIIALGSGALIVVLGLLYWWWSAREVPVAEPASPVATVPVLTPDDAEEPIPTLVPQPMLPALDDSDAFVREQVGALSERLAEWLAQEDLVRRFAVVIDNAAIGDIPRRQLGFLAPSGKYPVRVDDAGRTFVDPAGYGRFDPFVDTILSVPPEQAAALLRTLAPLLREALAELGQADADPISAVRAGVRQALQTPEPDGDIELVQPKVLYRYADPSLESLLPLQKQLLRMGPGNLTRIKAYLREAQKFL